MNLMDENQNASVGSMSKKKTLIELSVLGVLLLGCAGWYYFTSYRATQTDTTAQIETPTPAEESEEELLAESNKVFDELPDTNPFEGTNPISDAYTNPFAR